MSSTRTRHVESWLDWSVDEMWDTPRSRRGVALAGRARVEAVRFESARVESARVESARLKPAPVEPAHAEPAPVEPAHAEPAHGEPFRVRTGSGPMRAAVPGGDRQTSPRPATPARRTVTISGRGADPRAGVPFEGRPRPQRRKHERPGYRPDRAAMWAVLLGVVLLLVAAASSRGATPPAAHKQPAARVVVVAAPAHPAGRLR